MVVPPGRRERAVLLAILVVGLALRLGFILGQRGDVLFEHPQLDEQRYVQAARALATGRLDEDRPYWQPPGVIYALAAVTRVAGPSLLWPRLLQALLSTAACLLLFAIGRRLFGSAIALGAAAALALHGVVIYECAELLPPTWILFFDLLALYWLVDERRTVGRALAAGLALGVSALFSPTILPFVPVAAWAVRRPLLVCALAVGVIAPIAPVAVRNHAHGGERVLISSNGGLNFYLGNNQRSDETMALRPGRRWEELTTEPDRQSITRPGAQSSFFRHKALVFVARHPAQAAALMARKLYLYFNGGEIPRDSDLYAARHESILLSILVWPGPLRFPDGLLFPLGLVGAALCWRERRRLALLYAFVALHALVTAAFFVSARHRMPALGVWALLAAAGASELWRRRRWEPLAALGALIVLLNLPTREAAQSLAAEEDFNRGVAWQRELRDPEVAADWFRRAASEDPTDARAWFELGNCLEPLGRSDEATAAWRRAAAADPWDSRARRRLSQALAHRGDLDGAIAELRANIDAQLREPAHYAPDWLNLAFLLAQRGQLDAARQAVDSARRSDARYFAVHAGRMADKLDPPTRAALGL